MNEIEGTNKRRKMNSGESVNLESFYPTMELRVLLVEADDSTRQIVSALLRKCNYKVSAVADGLKAWELIKANPHNIDLILTEVDLPSISGFALLTLIMEHEICKTIPVIMMSSQDSSSTAYKCMLRGAADYFFKPIRRNELRNLWQHAWRRQSSIVGQKKVEASSENNAASDRSRGCLACVERFKEQNQKGSDTQSSCTKPDTEAEHANTENMLEFSCVPSNSLKHGVQANSIAKLLLVEAGGDALIDSPREAIDFMGTFDRNCDSSWINSTNEFDSSWINSTNEFDSSTRLDLSLSRCYRNASENHAPEERPTLWNPNSSAFTRYSSRPSQPLHSTLTSVSDPKQESGTSHEKMLSDSEYNFDTPSPTLTSQTNTNSSGQLYDQLTSNSNHLIDNPVHKPDQKLDSTEDRGHISPTLDQSPSSSLCNGSLSQLNGIAYGSSSASNGDIEEVAAVRASTESKNNDVFPSLGGNSHRSTQREAALTRFRLKRKDRSFEKKVRYESRKKLAEQRPRVKGQFVRQVPVDPSHVIIVT